jgi:hypothetical protein
MMGILIAWSEVRSIDASTREEQLIEATSLTPEMATWYHMRFVWNAVIGRRAYQADSPNPPLAKAPLGQSRATAWGRPPYPHSLIIG